MSEPTLDLEPLDDDAPDILAIEDTEPVRLMETDSHVADGDPFADQGCGCDMEDVVVVDDDDPVGHDGGAI